LLASGCGGTKNGGSGTDTAGSGRIAGENGGNVVSATQAPPFKFQPMSHAPIYRRTEAPTPNLNSFPALQIRFAQCFGKEEPEPMPIAAPSPSSPSGYKSPGRSSSSRTSKQGKAKGKSSGSSAGGSGSGAGAGIGNMGTFGAVPPPTQSKPSEKKKDSAAGPKPSPVTSAPAASPPLALSPPPASSPPPEASADMAASPEPQPLMSNAPPSEGYEDSKMSRKERRDERKRDKAEQEAREQAADDEAAQQASPQKIAGEEIVLPKQEPIPDPDMGYTDWGQATYLSNDDSMSLSSAQRIIYAIDHFEPLPQDQIRPHELLNYFSFATKEVTDGFDFSVEGDLIADPKENGIYSLGLAVNGRPVDKLSRRNTVLTLVIDRSGSMADEGRMDYLKRGLMRMVDELKAGDMVHLVIFDHEVCVPMENFVVGRDSRDKLEKVIFALQPRGSTDLNSGLATGYEIADRTYRNDTSNRVVLITDALTNTGVTDEQTISMISKYYESRRIRLSGVGVGREFNDSLLDRLTERGKGAYVFLGSEAEVDAVFGPRFISLIETTALDVHFRLHLPPSLRLNVFYGEESSTVKEDVQEIHYFANTSQLFLSDLMARGRTLRPQDEVMLTIEYKDPETEAPLVEEYAFNLAGLINRNTNAKKGRFIMAWVDLLAEMAARPVQSYGMYAEGSWQDEEGWNRCEQGRQMLSDMSRDISLDPEVTRVQQLFDKYCARYERPRHPTRRQIAVPDSSWPAAQGQ
jgi:Ca-activated chloride channel family protein